MDWETSGGVRPRGEVTRFGPHLIHWREQPGESPTVLLMNGCGLATEYWRELYRLLPGRHLVAYDRPGLGGTRWPGALPRLADEVQTAADLITAKGSPAVLVAHSMASFHAEALARLHPDLVSGVVMVDGSVEWLSTPPRPASAKPAQLVRSIAGSMTVGSLGAALWRLGTFAQSYWQLRRLGFGRLPEVYRDRNALAMATAESMAYNQQAWDLIQLREAHAYPNVPTVLLTAARHRDHERAKQARLARLLGGRQELVSRSRHLMMLDRPEAIAAAITEVAESADAASSL